MADKELQTILNSGGITSIYIGGTTTDKKAVISSELALVDNRVTALEAAQPFNHFYQFNSSQNHTVAGDTYEDILSLLTPALEAGTYEVRMATLHSLDSTTKSAFFRFTVDGGSTWTEIRREAKDNTDKVPMQFNIPVNKNAGEVLDVAIQARKEDANNILELYVSSIIVERKI